MSDVCERLVRFAGKVCISTDTEVEAASEIERLRAENEKLRAALKPFAEYPTPNSASDDGGLMVLVSDLRAAAAALKETGDE